MRENRVKRIMREGGLAIVSHVGFTDPAVIEIIAMPCRNRPVVSEKKFGFEPRVG